MGPLISSKRSPACLGIRTARSPSKARAGTPEDLAFPLPACGFAGVLGAGKGPSFKGQHRDAL